MRQELMWGVFEQDPAYRRIYKLADWNYGTINGYVWRPGCGIVNREKGGKAGLCGRGWLHGYDSIKDALTGYHTCYAINNEPFRIVECLAIVKGWDDTKALCVEMIPVRDVPVEEIQSALVELASDPKVLCYTFAKTYFMPEKAARLILESSEYAAHKGLAKNASTPKKIIMKLLDSPYEVICTAAKKALGAIEEEEACSDSS